MMGKGPTTNADMVFLDLEDACAPKEKEAARGKIVDAIKGHDWGDKVLCVRVNDWSTKWTAYDILEVVGNAGDRAHHRWSSQRAVCGSAAAQTRTRRK